jgi:hypothetical protein
MAEMGPHHRGAADLPAQRRFVDDHVQPERVVPLEQAPGASPARRRAARGFRAQLGGFHDSPRVVRRLQEARLVRQGARQHRVRPSCPRAAGSWRGDYTIRVTTAHPPAGKHGLAAGQQPPDAGKGNPQ